MEKLKYANVKTADVEQNVKPVDVQQEHKRPKFVLTSLILNVWTEPWTIADLVTQEVLGDVEEGKWEDAREEWEELVVAQFAQKQIQKSQEVLDQWRNVNQQHADVEQKLSLSVEVLQLNKEKNVFPKKNFHVLQDVRRPEFARQTLNQYVRKDMFQDVYVFVKE